MSDLSGYTMHRITRKEKNENQLRSSAVWHLAQSPIKLIPYGALVKWFDMNLCEISDENHLL